MSRFVDDIPHAASANTAWIGIGVTLILRENDNCDKWQTAENFSLAEINLHFLKLRKKFLPHCSKYCISNRLTERLPDPHSTKQSRKFLLQEMSQQVLLYVAKIRFLNNTALTRLSILLMWFLASLKTRRFDFSLRYQEATIEWAL